MKGILRMKITLTIPRLPCCSRCWPRLLWRGRLAPIGHDCLKVAWTTRARTRGLDAAGQRRHQRHELGEAGGDLLLYVGKCDSWDENGRLLKLGRLRFRFSQQPFANGKPFRQTLHADRGEIEIVAGETGRDLRRSAVGRCPPARGPHRNRVDQESNWRRLEVWRTAERELPENEDHCPIGKLSTDERTKVTPDTILDVPNALAWYHRNERSVWAGTLRHQDLASLIPKFHDPLLDLTSGALVVGESFAAWTAPRCVRRRRASDSWSACIRGWRRRLPPQIGWPACGSRQRPPAKSSRQNADEHRAWWESFWQRSQVVVSGSPEAERVCRGYNLQRFLQASPAAAVSHEVQRFAVHRGRHPAAQAAAQVPEVFDADFRLWGGGYWFQNCRLLNWPMLMAGDFDLMQPFFRLYQDALPLAEARPESTSTTAAPSSRRRWPSGART